MKKILLFLFASFLAIPLFSQQALDRYYFYDNAGNRILRSVIQMPEGKNAESSDTNSEESFTQHQEIDSLRFVDQMGDILLNAYPNPVTKILHVTIGNYDEFKEGAMQLYNINGQLLRSFAVNSSHTEIDLSSYASGIYVLRLNLNGHRKEWKIIKE